MTESMTKRQFLRATSAIALTAAAAHLIPASPALSAEGQSGSPLLLWKADNLPQQEILAWLKALRGRPYVAQSGFDVTAVFKINTPEGIYHVAGANVENRELTVGTCGEEGVIATAVTAFGQKIDILEGWLMGAPSGAESSDLACYPCGECRQRIAQYAAPDAPFHIMALNGRELDVKTRGELMPHAFSFRDLPDGGGDGGATEPAPVSKAELRLYRKPQKTLTLRQVFDWLNGLRSDARVSRWNEMTVWRLGNGAYVAGVKVENAAYPSSTNVMSAAAAVMNARFGKQKVEEAWAYGFHNAVEGQPAAKDGYYQASGASLQVLREFASSGEVKLHSFNSAGEVKSAALKDLLPVAVVFG